MKLITTKNAAAILGITPGRVRQLVLAGRMSGQRKIGRDWFCDYPPAVLPPKRKPANPN